MANLMYTNFWKHLGEGNIDLEGDTIKCALVTSSYSPNQDTHEYFDDVTNEVAGTGYTAGGATLGSVAVTADTTNNRAKVDAVDTEWSSATITFRAAVIYKSTGTASTSPLIAYYDFTDNQVASSQDVTIQWNASGTFAIG